MLRPFERGHLDAPGYSDLRPVLIFGQLGLGLSVAAAKSFQSLAVITIVAIVVHVLYSSWSVDRRAIGVPCHSVPLVDGVQLLLVYLVHKFLILGDSVVDLRHVV